jgi:diguanylate cyclase (GGDEF)-like protein
MASLERMDSGPQEMGKRVRMVDVDLINLNRVNYEFGQMVGDAVLQDLGEMLRNECDEEHVVGRFGGDEFLVVMASATASEAQALAEKLRSKIESYTLNLPDRGEVSGLKAQVSVADYVPERESLHESVISAKEATAHGRLPDEADGVSPVCYHVPRVTLGAFAVRRWQNLNKEEQDSFKQWKREPGGRADSNMCADILRMLEEKAEINWVDFVTAIPAASGTRPGRPHAAKLLAQAVAEQLGVPYRDVMRADSSGPENRSVVPAVDAVIDKGDGVLLVSDVISSGIVERRCVKKLSAAGAHVQVVAWAAY